VDQSIIHELAPVVSFCKIAGCFADIRVPNHYNQQHGGQCTPAGSAAVPWSQKASPLAGGQFMADWCWEGLVVLRAWLPWLLWLLEKSITPVMQEPVLFWRGATTGTTANPYWATAEKIRMFQRSRLVAWGRAKNSTLYDFGFVSVELQGQPYGDIPLELNGGSLSERVMPESFYRYKYLLVIDGNAVSARGFRFLCSSSLTFMVEGMSEW
jgi:hypothetical protein